MLPCNWFIISAFATPFLPLSWYKTHFRAVLLSIPEKWSADAFPCFSSSPISYKLLLKITTRFSDQACSPFCLGLNDLLVPAIISSSYK
jgi:hypothetical protein